MVLPPPNVTGKLHLGHAVAVTFEDTLCRHHRIKGGVVSKLICPSEGHTLKWLFLFSPILLICF